MLISENIQAPIFYGPERAGCVSKQTLKDDSCLVACDGLYADISDDSFQQKTIKGDLHLICSICFKVNPIQDFAT